MDPQEARRHHSRYSKGDRDDLAREGHRVYERHQKRRRVRPDSGHVSPFVDEATRREVQAHLLALGESGVGVDRLHRVTGVAVSTIQGIRSGRTRRVSRRVADVLLAVHLGRIPVKRKRGEGSRLNPRSDLATTKGQR